MNYLLFAFTSNTSSRSLVLSSTEGILGNGALGTGSYQKAADDQSSSLSINSPLTPIC